MCTCRSGMVSSSTLKSRIADGPGVCLGNSLKCHFGRAKFLVALPVGLHFETRSCEKWLANLCCVQVTPDGGGARPWGWRPPLRPAGVGGGAVLGGGGGGQCRRAAGSASGGGSSGPAHATAPAATRFPLPMELRDRQTGPPPPIVTSLN